jgi:hypothetical protein
MAVYRDTATHELIDEDEMHGRAVIPVIARPSGPHGTAASCLDVVRRRV